MEKQSPREIIEKLLKEKSLVKLTVYEQTENVFVQFKAILKEIVADLKKKVAAIDKRIPVEFKDRGEFEVELIIASDALIFHMHTNVFEFDKSHSMWKSSYVRNNEANSFCGTINVYNFLYDSFKFNRTNDLGYLIARIFINRELHYFVEGKRQLGFLYNDFVHNVIDKKAITAIIESSIIYALDFDLFAPPFDAIKEVSVMEIEEASNMMQIKTGKRLGFRFLADNDEID